MNILVLTNQLPWPPAAGGQASQFATLKALANDHKFRIILTDCCSFREADAQSLEAELPSITVVRPVFSRAIEKRDFIIKASLVFKGYFKSIYYKFKTLKKKEEDRIEEALDLPVQAERPYFPFNRLSIEVVKSIANNIEWTNLLQAEFHETLFTGFLESGRIPKLFICHQAHGAYTRSFYESRPPGEVQASAFHQLIAESDVKTAIQLESALMNNFDHIVVFSEQDKKDIHGLDHGKVTVSPFPLPADVKWINPLDVNFMYDKVVLVGPGHWHPNVEALDWFIKGVWPSLLKNNPTFPLKLYVVGNWNTHQVEKYQTDSILFEGFVDDLSAFLQGAISINPVFTGAGLRTKLLASAASASPIVSSSLGAEGTGFIHDQHCLIADDPNLFATSVNALIHNKSLAQRLAVMAFQRAQTCFSQEAVRKKRNYIYSQLMRAASNQ